jgi:ribosome-binding factor A
MARFDNPRAGPSQRQLRVGELVRHALADVLMRGGFSDPELLGVLVTIAEVRMSPDLKHATAFVAPLGKEDPETVVGALNRSAGFLRRQIAPALRQMKSLPDLRFRADTRFEDDRRIDELLRSPEVARDLGPSEDED